MIVDVRNGPITAPTAKINSNPLATSTYSSGEAKSFAEATLSEYSGNADAPKKNAEMNIPGLHNHNRLNRHIAIPAKEAVMQVRAITFRRSVLSEAKPISACPIAPAITVMLMNHATPAVLIPLFLANTGPSCQKELFARPTTRQPKNPTGDSL